MSRKFRKFPEICVAAHGAAPQHNKGTDVEGGGHFGERGNREIRAFRIGRGHLFGYAVKMKSVGAASLWQAVPHLASLPCGGLPAKVPGENVSDAAS